MTEAAKGAACRGSDEVFSDGSLKQGPNYFDRSSSTGATISCKRFDYADPKPHMIFPWDVVLGLSRESRYNGQTLTPVKFTVAQHSHLVWQKVFEMSPLNWVLQLEALLHDGAKAFCKDVPRPLKKILPGYQKIEIGVDRALRARFKLPQDKDHMIKAIDCRMLATECRDIAPQHPEFLDILKVYQPYNDRIDPKETWTEPQAVQEFGQVLRLLLQKTGQAELLWA